MKYFVLILMLVFAVGASCLMAQEATEVPSESGVTAEAWLVTDLDEEESEDAVARYVVFLTLDDGDTLIEVAAGEDVIYTKGEDGLYSGAPLIPTDRYEFEATLEVVDDDTYQVASAIKTGSLTFESNLLFERSDLEFGVWVEGERNLTEYSMFAECMGRVGVEPPGAFAEPDPILLIRVDDEAGTLTIGNTVLAGGGGAYELVEEGEFGQFTQVVTQTASVSEASIAFTYHAIADERDDCELHYETTFTPFDGDFEALMARAEELGAEE
jgi:hypothetical protein